MPPVVAAVAGYAAAGLAVKAGFVVAGSIGFTAIASVVAFGVNTALSAAMTKKPGTVSTDQGLKTLLRLPDAPHRIVYGRARVGGTAVYFETANTGPDKNGNPVSRTNEFLHMVVAVAGHEIDSFEQFYVNDTPVTLDVNGFVQESEFNLGGDSFVRIRAYTGTDDQTADPLLVAEGPNWTANHRLRGIAYIYARLRWDSNVWPNGIPSINAVVKGKKVYDPREGGHDIDDKTTWEWSDNAALCVRDYLSSRDAGNIPYGFGASAEEIDDDFTVEAANICDESVTKRDGSTIARYTLNGVLDTSEGVLNNLERMLSAMVGTVTTPKGQFRIYAGAYDTPESTVIDESMLAGPMRARLRTPLQQLFNAVQGTHMSPDAGWQMTDFTPITSDTFEEQDGDERIFTDIELPFTLDPEAAQRIAKIIQRKAREQITVTLPLKFKALRYAVWDTVKLNNTTHGWSEKVFRVERIAYDPEAGVTLFLREENPLSYDWSATDAEVVDAAPDTNLPNPAFVEPPVSLTVTEELYITRNGDGVKAKAVLNWVESPDAFLNEYQAEYKLTDDSEWTLLPRSEATTAEILDIAPGTYNFRVKAISTLNVSSAYATDTRQISGLAAPPTAPEDLYWSAIGGLAYLNWSPSPDLDVRIGGKYVFRYSPDTSATWGSSTSIGNAVSGNASSVVLPLMPGIYLVKAEDSSEIQSETAASVIVTQDTILTLSVIETVTEDPTFAGSKTNCSVASSLLSLTDTTLPGTYLFDNQMDLGSVKRVRLTAHLVASVVNPSDLFDDGDGNFDDGEGDYDGLDSAAADAVVFVRSTQTDPGGSPTWTGWNRLHSGEFVGWGFEFKVELVSYDSAFNIEISELNVKAAEI